MREILRLVVVLTGICIVMSFSLAFVRQATEAPIITNRIKFIKLPAIKAVLPAYDNDPVMDRKDIDVGEGKIVTVYPAKKAGEYIGFAYETEGEGHGGPVEIMLGVDMEGGLWGISIMKHAETPGIGDAIENPEWQKQFKGMSLDTDFSLEDEGGDVQGISGATESSTAVAEGVGKGMELFEELKDKLAG